MQLLKHPPLSTGLKVHQGLLINALHKNFYIIGSNCTIIHFKSNQTLSLTLFFSPNTFIRHLPSYTQSGIPFEITFSSPLSVTFAGLDSGLVLMYTSFLQTKALKCKQKHSETLYTLRLKPFYFAQVFGKGCA